MSSFSQFGEDVVIDKYITENNIKISPFIVDIGAAYPEHISNSRFFIKKGWSALLIEINSYFFNLLERYYQDNDKVVVSQTLISDIDGSVSFDNNNEEFTLSGISKAGSGVKTPSNKLSTLLKKTKINKDIGILSLDAEGYDYEIMKSILDDNIKPQIIIIEANGIEERNKQKELLGKHYQPFAYTGHGALRGRKSMFIDKLIYGISKIHIFASVNTLWIKKELYK